MAINTKAKKVLAAERKGPQASTHFPNDETSELEVESGYEVRNQQDPQELLFDPDQEGGNTHFGNDLNVGESGVVKTKASVAPTRKVQAPVRKIQTNAASRITANDIDLENDEASGFTQDVDNEGDNSTFGPDETGGVATARARRVRASEGGQDGPQATTHFPNGELTGSDEEATQGYLTVGDLTDMGPDSDSVGSDFGGGEGEGEDEMGGGEVDAEFEDMGGDEEFEDEDEDQEVHAEFQDAGEDIDPAGLEHGEAPQQSLLDVTDEIENPAEASVEEEEFGEEDMGDIAGAAGADEMPLMDVDGMDDGMEGLTTASMGTVLHAIRAGRIVASMNKKLAIKAGAADVYLGDEFHTATLAECQAFGLRAGLRNMGFVLAKVNVGKSDVLNKRVEARAKQVTASIKRTSAASNEALGQCLAIAAVGINRQYFRDTRNELRAALETELAAAGLRGGSKLVRRVFASHGVDYAKAILTLANKLVSMPETARNAFASALDMTDGEGFDQEEGVNDAEGDEFGNDQGPDFQAEASDDMGDFGADDGFESDFEGEEAAPETIHAALANPAWRAQRVQASAQAKPQSYSVQAAAILNGTAHLGLGI